jgi:hypothetical protein
MIDDGSNSQLVERHTYEIKMNIEALVSFHTPLNNQP